MHEDPWLMVFKRKRTSRENATFSQWWSQMTWNLFPMTPSTAQNCSGLRTCAACLERAECGWCGDPTNTGKGVCMEGSYRGPMKTPAERVGQRVRDKDMVLDQSLCSSDRGSNWAFIQCPGKQRLFISYITLITHENISKIVEPHTILHVKLISHSVRCVSCSDSVSV